MHYLFVFYYFLTNINAQILLVPEIEQEQNQWCWAGVSKCVLDYYGDTVQQCEIAEYTRNVATFNNFGTVNCCVSPNHGCNYWNYNWGNSGSIEDILLNFGGITTTNLGSVLSQSQWQSEVANNTPFIIRIGWNNGGGHFVVGYGKVGSDYYTMDPWFNEGYTISTYNWVVTGQGGAGSWTHSQTLSPAPYFGCMDLLACNYDSLATIDDGTCIFPVIWQQSFSICNGDSIVVGSNVYNASGNYIDTLNVLNGCDSIIYTNISIFQSNGWQQSFSICNGDSIVVGSNVYNNSGNYIDTLTALNGCDSIVYTTISILQSNFNIPTNPNRKLQMTFDILGRETKQTNQPLFYIYDDRTVEKKLIIE